MLSLLALGAIFNNVLKKDAATGCPNAIKRKKECEESAQALAGMFWLILGLGYILDLLGII